MTTKNANPMPTSDAGELMRNNSTVFTPEQEAALTAIADLMRSHFSDAEDSADEDGKFSIGFRATFDRGSSPTKVKVTSRISVTSTDEIETTAKDPNQPEFL